MLLSIWEVAGNGRTQRFLRVWEKLSEGQSAICCPQRSARSLLLETRKGARYAFTPGLAHLLLL